MVSRTYVQVMYLFRVVCRPKNCNLESIIFLSSTIYTALYDYEHRLLRDVVNKVAPILVRELTNPHAISYVGRIIRSVHSFLRIRRWISM